jgi:hypothetical protein
MSEPTNAVRRRLDCRPCRTRRSHRFVCTDGNDAGRAVWKCAACGGYAVVPARSTAAVKHSDQIAMPKPRVHLPTLLDVPLVELLDETRPFSYPQLDWKKLLAQFDAKFAQDGRVLGWVSYMRRHGITRRISLMQYGRERHVMEDECRIWVARKSGLVTIPCSLFIEG